MRAFCPKVSYSISASLSVIGPNSEYHFPSVTVVVSCGGGLLQGLNGSNATWFLPASKAAGVASPQTYRPRQNCPHQNLCFTICHCLLILPFYLLYLCIYLYAYSIVFIIYLCCTLLELCYVQVCDLYCGKVPDSEKWDNAVIGHYIGVGILLLQFYLFIYFFKFYVILVSYLELICCIW